MVTFANLGSVRLPYLLTYLITKSEVRRPSRSEDTAYLVYQPSMFGRSRS